MISPESKQTVQALCPEVSASFLQDFFDRMDDDYFAAFSAKEIAMHIRMSAGLDSQHRVQVRITERAKGEFDIIIVGFDYLSQFSIFCGMLSAFALNIRAGDIYSYSRRNSRRVSHRIVDVFRVAITSGERFDDVKQREFEQELQTLAQLLAAGSIEEARGRVHRYLTERIEGMNEPPSGLLAPVELEFDNTFSAQWTLLNVRSDDAFGFLYAVSNALSMRGIYVHRVTVRSVERQVQDQFLIANRSGAKIERPQEQQRLQMAVAMMTQFTRFLTEAPDPAKAMRHFDRFLDKIVEIGEEEFPDHTIAFLASSDGMNLLAQLLGSSDFLWDDFLQMHFMELLPALEEFTTRKPYAGKETLREELRRSLAVPGGGNLQDQKTILNRFKDRHVFLIDVRHLLETEATRMDFSQALTDLGEVVLEEAARICHAHLAATQGEPRQPDGKPCPFAIFGLGKFGGREMGYASDLELLFVHGSSEGNAFFETLAQNTAGFIEARDKGIFHIDMRLRPYGDAGAWSIPFAQFVKYYGMSDGAASFERQALIKLRWFGGDAELGRSVEAHRDKFTYSDAPWDWKNAVHLRRRQMRELVPSGRVNVKYSAGGIVDIEYAVQYLQLLNGKAHPEVRVPGTLNALNALRRLQIVREADFEVLHAGYLFLRKLIDALRIVRGDASDLVLPEEASEEMKALARRLSYRERERAKSAARLAADIRETMRKVHEYFVGRFAVPDGGQN